MMHRRAAGSQPPISCLSGINQGAAQRLEFRGRSQRLYKFSQTSTSETQSKWLVQKSGSEREGWLPGQSPSTTASVTLQRITALYYSTNTVLCLNTGYSLAM